MKTIYTISLFFIAFIFISCDKDNEPDPEETISEYVTGQNHIVMNVGGTSREFYVHVPEGYTGESATPVVFMLHGTGGNGLEFYENSGWREVGDTENIITVFPSAIQYCIIDDGVVKNITKWNSVPASWTFCADEIQYDDIEFFKEIITDLNENLNVDNRRIYLVGFSNGGEMAAKCSIEMSDVFAAIVESAGSFYVEDCLNIPTYTPIRKMPITLQIGNRDYGPGNIGDPIPLSYFDTLLTTPCLDIRNGTHYNKAHAQINSFELNPEFVLTGDTNSIVVASYSALDGDPLNKFNFVFVDSLAHAYPNGINHPIHAAVLNWDWLKQFSLPE